MQPLVGDPFAATRGVSVIPTYWPIPNVGHLPMNAFLVHGEEPVLVDTGVGVLSDQFVQALESLVAPGDLRWIWLTHDDRDHTGSLARLLDLAPKARVLTPFFAIGRMLPEASLPLDRLHLVNPGETVSVGDRTLTAIRPPLYDSPATAGFVDDRSGVLFTSDCFGAPLPTLDEAMAHDIAELPDTLVRSNQIAWATMDSPWVTSVDRQLFDRSLDRVRQLAPRAILSSHLPPVHGRVTEVLAALRDATGAEPPPGTTQVELEAFLASMQPA